MSLPKPWPTSKLRCACGHDVGASCLIFILYLNDLWGDVFLIIRGKYECKIYCKYSLIIENMRGFGLYRYLRDYELFK